MYKLIVADCSPSVYSAVQAAFPDTEYEIMAFSDGTEVIKAVGKTQPDAILLNVFLESKDGYEVCHFLNSQENYRNIPIFLLKGAFESIDEERMNELEYRELIDEPFDSKDLARKVREVLEGKDDPLTLPEEPVLAENSRFSLGIEDKIKNVVSEELLKSEEQIAKRLKDRILKEVRKELHGELRNFDKSENSKK